MKINILGLLRMAQRHLVLLDRIRLANSNEQEISDLISRMEVNAAGKLLTELMENISAVQADPKQLDDFLKLYCLKAAIDDFEENEVQDDEHF